jgi:fructoselysine-6-P-deglycase FrlB-like protein
MSPDAAFDPTAPLPGPPDPWAFTGTPTPRSGPPYHMTEMIEAEPGLARRIAARQAGPDSQAAALAARVREVAVAGEPVHVTGCGTSEHAAQAAAEILDEAIRRAGLGGPSPHAAQAFELALDAPSSGLLIGVSHEGGTGATNAALTAARARGAATALITVSARSPGAALVDLVVETGELDQGWCHTVGYLSPILAAASVGGHLSGTPLDGVAAAAVLAAGTKDTTGAERIAGRFADAAHLIVIASGADRAAGRELALKVEEASWLPSAYRDLETFLHGHIPATDASTALVLVLADRAGRAERLARARQALAAAAVLGLRSAAILAADLDGELDPALTPAGRLLVADAPGLASPVAAMVGTATPLQLLTERIARARGTNPDPIRRDDPRYVEAANAAGG